MSDQDDQDDPGRTIIERALAELAAVIAANTGSDQPICTNYVLVSEWSTVDGQQWITREWAQRSTVWQRDGLLHHALYGSWAGALE